MSEIIDEMLADLVLTRQTMQKQVGKIGEIMEKSNKTLLHIETQNLPPHSRTITSPPSDEAAESQSIFNLKPECEQSIVKILEQFHLLMQQSVNGDNNLGGPSAQDACLTYRHHSEYLGSSVRKLVAFCDTMNQLKLNLQMQEELDEEDKENNEEEY
ncbi:augmin complex subunit msd1 [Drosophila innubila]|uniref:augmin complex subunit msd1 n=1 Tax=Drosophila innubila TaxID=198719 RepID=UPI00148E69A0|nr:augmin complex subunit msd1 [Drosophila innubila]